MEPFSYLVGYTFFIGFMVFVGSYFGIFKKKTHKLPRVELVGLFFVLWALSAALLFMFRAASSSLGLAGLPESVDLFITLAGGIYIGRKMVASRLKSHQKISS